MTIMINVSRNFDFNHWIIKKYAKNRALNCNAIKSAKMALSPCMDKMALVILSKVGTYPTHHLNKILHDVYIYLRFSYGVQKMFVLP